MILCVPLMMKVGEVTVYEETELAPEGIESQSAQDIINDQFPTALANSTVMVVMQYPDVRDEEVKNFTMEFAEEVQNDPEIEYLQFVMTIYSVYDKIMKSTVSTISPFLYEVENSTNMSTYLFYGIPVMYAETWVQVNGTCFMVYGVPSIYLGEWFSQGMNDTLANISTSAILNNLLSTGDYNLTEQQMIWGYYSTFFTFWNLSMEPDPLLRAQYAIDNATIQFTSGLPQAQSQFIQGIWQSFNLTTWSNVNFQNVFTNTTFWSMASLYGIGPEEVQMIEPYYYEFYYEWGMSFNNASLINSTPYERVQYSVELAGPQYIDDNFAGDENQLMHLILVSFNVTTWSNKTLIHSFTINTFASMAESMFGVSDIDLFEDIYALGPLPSQANISLFSRFIIENGTFETYPIPIPPDIYSEFISPNNDTTLVIIGFSKGASGFGGGETIPRNIEIIRDTVGNLKSSMGLQGLTTYVSGDAALSADLSKEADEDIKRIDPITITLIIVLLGLFFLSIVTPFVPLGVIGVAIVVSQGAIFLVGSYIGNIHYSAITMLIPLLLAIGVDYSIFIIARYREERKGGANREEAVRTSVTWAGESIATSGGVVMISFGALSVAGFGMIRVMGLVFMFGVGIALLAALTFLPALMLLIGNRMFWPSRRLKRKTWLDSGNEKNNPGNNPKKKKEKKVKKGYFGNAARFSLKHAKAIVIVALLISIPTTIAVFSLESSFDFIAGMPGVESKEGLDAMTEGFGAGNILPTYVVVKFPDRIYNGTSYDNASLNSIDNLTSRISTLDNIERVDASIYYQGTRIDNVIWTGYGQAEQFAIIDSSIGRDSDTVLIQVVFEEEPFTKRSMETIPVIRAEIQTIQTEDDNLRDAVIYVGGQTASMRDIQDSTANDFRNMAIIVIVGIFILLLIILGSVLVPLRLILTIALSISWALAMTMFLFEFVKGIPVLWLMPMILFIMLMGLGMDYDIFLVTRIREEVMKGKTDEEAIVTAVERTGGIITACGIIMAGAFASLMLSSMGLLQEFGFGLSFAIIIDAMLVRIYLVPAIMVLLKKWNWWAPGRLQRVKRNEKKAKMKVKKKKTTVKKKVVKKEKSANKKRK